MNDQKNEGNGKTRQMPIHGEDRDGPNAVIGADRKALQNPCPRRMRSRGFAGGAHLHQTQLGTTSRRILALRRATGAPDAPYQHGGNGRIVDRRDHRDRKLN